MGIGNGDYIDKMLVDKYQDKLTVNKDLLNPPGKVCTTWDCTDKQLDYECDYTKIREEFLELKSKYEKLLNMHLPNKKQLQELRGQMQDFVNPNKMYERLGVDVLSVLVACNLSTVANPLKDGKLLEDIMILRHRMTDTLGYILPSVSIRDLSNLEDNTFEIRVRGKSVYTGKLSDEDIANNNCDEIINKLYEMCIKYAHQVVSKNDILKLMELVRFQDPTLVNDLVPLFISAIDLKHIFANLYQAQVSIKDIILVFEILNDHARFTQDRNELTEILKEALSFYKD